MSTTPTNSLEEIITALQTSWGDEFGAWGPYRNWQSGPVSWSVPTVVPSVEIPGAEEPAGFVSPAGTSLMFVAGQAFSLWADLMALPLVQVSDENADITLAYSSTTKRSGTYASPGLSLDDWIKYLALEADGPGLDAALGWLSPPLLLAYHALKLSGVVEKPYDDGWWFDRGHLWISTNAVKWPNLQPPALLNAAGTIPYEAVAGFSGIVHEIGHSLGLSHPGPYDAGDPVAPTYANNAAFPTDTRQYTLMSYFGGYKIGTGWVLDGNENLHPATPMVYDVAAIQSKYGANPNTRAGDTTYGFNVSADVPTVFDFNINTTPILTIYDAGGIDTLDLSQAPADGPAQQWIDLEPGAYSGVLGMKENAAIALSTVIENAIGGPGVDEILGNSAGNLLDGRDGDDQIAGFVGQDTLLGGAGKDKLEGGSGSDLIEGGIGEDDLLGGLGGDTLFGGPGPDRLDGGPDGDLLYGGVRPGDPALPPVNDDRDVFVFSSGYGEDVIADFDMRPHYPFGIGDDVDLTGLRGVYNFDDLLEHAFDLPGIGVRLDFNGGDSLTLLGLDRDALLPDFFRFSEAPREGGEFTPFGELFGGLGAVSALPGGRFVMVWTDDPVDGGGDGSGGAIQGRVFEADGRGGEIFRVNSTLTGAQSRPAIVTQANGRFVVAWTSDENADGAGTWLRARVFESDGTPLANDFRINTTPEINTPGSAKSFTLLPGDLAPIGSDGFVATWSSAIPVLIGADSLIRARVFLHDGASAESDFVVSRPSIDPQTGLLLGGSDYRWPQLIPMDSGTSMVTFQAQDYPAVLGGRTAVLGGALQTNGSPSTVTSLASGTPGIPTPEVMRIINGYEAVPLGDDDMLVVTLVEVSGTAAGPSETYNHRAYRVDGSIVGPTGSGGVFQIVATPWMSPATFLSSNVPSITAARLPDGSALVAWADTDVGLGNVHAYHVHADGGVTELRTLDGWPSVMLAAHQHGKVAGDAAGLDDGRVVVTWADVNANGSLGGPQAVILRPDLHGVTLGGTSAGERLVGSGWDDHINAGPGNDTLVGRAGADRLDGGEGVDTADYGMSLDGIRVDLLSAGPQLMTEGGAHSDGDVLLNIENIRGSAYEDLILGDGGPNQLDGQYGADRIEGGGGDDLLIGGPGSDRLIGGSDNDTASYADSRAGVTLDLRNAGSQIGGDADGDRLEGIENLIGSPSADSLTGNSGPNRLAGGGGSDLIDGDSGIDVAVYAGARAYFRFGIQTDGSTFVDDVRTGERDSLLRVERAAFDDGELDLATLLPAPPPPNTVVARDDAFSASGTFTVKTGALTANDHDPQGDAFSLTEVGQATNGTVELANDFVTFSPAPGFVGLGGFTYTITDSRGAVANAFVSMTIVLPNQAPLAVDDGLFYVARDDRLVIEPATLLSNDADAEGDVLTVYEVQGAQHGDLSLGGAGRVSYVPAPGYVGSDEFRYAIYDGQNVATARVQVQVEDPYAGWQPGTQGDDTMPGNLRTSNTIFGDLGSDTIGGGLRDDQLAGGAGNDQLNGLSGHDTLQGGEGDDQLGGGAGNDRLEGDGGNDTITGGWGADTFVFRRGDGNDTITDFAAASAAGNDLIELHIPDVASLGQLMVAAQQTAEGVLLEFGEGDSLLILGAALPAVQADWFGFA